MRADVMTPCDPSLPSGIPHTPEDASNPPTHPHQGVARKRKQNTHRIRHSSSFSDASSRGAPPMLPPVSDPQTLQEKKELLEYFQKLRVLVPSLPKTGKIPKLDVIEHVIHYIRQLESQLIDHPMIQVLENNAYISGLLQSMAPDFDISHLFPARTNNNGLPSSSQQGYSSSIMAGQQQQYPSTSHSLMSRQQSGLFSESSANSSIGRSTPTKLKSKRSSGRKPLTLISSTNSTN